LRTKMRGLADEIADSLIQELRNRAAEESSYEEGTSHEMANEAVENEPEEEIRSRPVVSQATSSATSPEEEHLTLPVVSQKTSTGAAPMDTGVQARIGALETQLEALAKRITEAFQSGEGTNLPNLKYAKPKYQNVESLLNYIESKDDEGGVKLVIMNFND